MRKVCIVGFSELSREWALEQPPDVEIWGMNEAHKFLRKYDRWFQIHPKNWNGEITSKKAYTFSVACETCGWAETGKPDDKGSIDTVKRMAQVHANKYDSHHVEAGVVKLPNDTFGRTPHHLRWLAKCGVPVYTKELDERIPTSVRYPIEEVTERFGIPDLDGKKRPYLTSSGDYMVALALLEGVDEIRIAGIELVIGTEYAHQRPGFEFWLGRALGMGVNVVRSPYGSSLLTGPIYAIETSAPMQQGMLQSVGLMRTPDVPSAAVAETNDGVPIGLPQ